MNENLDWFNRVFDALGDGESYDDWDFAEALDDGSVMFKKRMGSRHPHIELYDVEDDEGIVSICFDPLNQQFYFSSLDKKVHMLLESFEEIQELVSVRWNQHFFGIDDEEDEDDELEFPDVEMDLFGQFSSFKDNAPNPLIAAYLLEEQHDESMMRAKLDTIEWIEEEKIVSSIKIDIPVSMEKQILLRIGIIPSTNERVLCKEKRFLQAGDLVSSSSQVFIIDDQELSLMGEMIQNHL